MRTATPIVMLFIRLTTDLVREVVVLVLHVDDAAVSGLAAGHVLPGQEALRRKLQKKTKGN